MKIFTAADILLPDGCDFTKWSVVACDQYSSEKSYWESADELVGDAPSSLRLILPEAYLGDETEAKRVEDINKTMRRYLDTGVFAELCDSMIYVEREQSGGGVRHGIVGAIDLECYDYAKGSQSPVRATEGTIVSRIPPRKRVRMDAPLELPHILMLIDDRDGTVIEPVTARCEELRTLYDFDLMLGGGHIRGKLLDNKAKAGVARALEALEDAAAFESKYGVSGAGTLVIAVGDGNHSLATAKACWEEIKPTLSEKERESHPARYALAELVNIHDPALEFEPIHRVVFETDPTALETAMAEYYPQLSDVDNGGQKITIVRGDTEKTVYVKDAPSNLSVGTLQKFLDDYLAKNLGRIDYIHGEDAVRALAKGDGAIGFILEGMRKNDLFTTVIKDGALPRKTFSMGEASDKRYYLEAKRIR